MTTDATPVREEFYPPLAARQWPPIGEDGGERARPLIVSVDGFDVESKKRGACGDDGPGRQSGVPIRTQTALLLTGEPSAHAADFACAGLRLINGAFNHWVWRIFAHAVRAVDGMLTMTVDVLGKFTYGCRRRAASN
jgi:hypothetical protein